VLGDLDRIGDRRIPVLSFPFFFFFLGSHGRWAAGGFTARHVSVFFLSLPSQGKPGSPFPLFLSPPFLRQGKVKQHQASFPLLLLFVEELEANPDISFPPSCAHRCERRERKGQDNPRSFPPPLAAVKGPLFLFPPSFLPFPSPCLKTALPEMANRPVEESGFLIPFFSLRPGQRRRPPRGRARAGPPLLFLFFFLGWGGRMRKSCIRLAQSRPVFSPPLFLWPGLHSSSAAKDAAFLFLFFFFFPCGADPADKPTSTRRFPKPSPSSPSA